MPTQIYRGESVLLRARKRFEDENREFPFELYTGPTDDRIKTQVMLAGKALCAIKKPVMDAILDHALGQAALKGAFETIINWQVNWQRAIATVIAPSRRNAALIKIHYAPARLPDQTPQGYTSTTSRRKGSQPPPSTAPLRDGVPYAGDLVFRRAGFSC